MSYRLSLPLLAVVLAAAPPVGAAGKGLFLGALAGDASYQVDTGNFDDGSISGAELDKTESALRVSLGWRFGPAWSVEGGWTDFSYDADDRPTFSGISDGSGSEFAAGPVSREIEPEGLYVALVANLYSGRRFEVFALGGYHAWRADVRTVDALGPRDEEPDGGDLVYGAGARLRLFNRLWAQGRWERFNDVAGDDIELTSLGLAFELFKR